MGNALVVIDDGIESVNVKNRYQGARVSARRANREQKDGSRWKFVHGRVVVVRWYGIKWLASSPPRMMYEAVRCGSLSVCKDDLKNSMTSDLVVQADVKDGHGICRQ